MNNQCEFCGATERLLATHYTSKRASNFCGDCIREVGTTANFPLIKNDASCDFCSSSETLVAVHKSGLAICFKCVADATVGTQPCPRILCSVCNAPIVDQLESCIIPDQFENLHGRVIPIIVYRCLECRGKYETEEQKLARESRSPYVDVKLLTPTEDCLNLIPFSWMKNHSILPFRIDAARERAKVHVAMADPNDQFTKDFACEFFLPEMFVKTHVCKLGDLQMILEKLCRGNVEPPPPTSCDLCRTEMGLITTHDTKRRVSRFCTSCMKDALCMITSGETTEHFRIAELSNCDFCFNYAKSNAVIHKTGQTICSRCVAANTLEIRFGPNYKNLFTYKGPACR